MFIFQGYLILKVSKQFLFVTLSGKYVLLKKNCKIKLNQNISHGVYTNRDIVCNAECYMCTFILKPKHHTGFCFLLPTRQLQLLRAFSQTCAPSCGVSRNSMPSWKQYSSLDCLFSLPINLQEGEEYLILVEKKFIILKYLQQLLL